LQFQSKLRMGRGRWQLAPGCLPDYSCLLGINIPLSYVIIWQGFTQIIIFLFLLITLRLIRDFDQLAVEIRFWHSYPKRCANLKTSMELTEPFMFYKLFLYPTVLEWHSLKPERYVKIMHRHASSGSHAWLIFGKNA